MKRLILIVINYTCLYYYKIKFFFILHFVIRQRKIVFIDIDNTIADTWPTIANNKYLNEFDRNLNIPMHHGMKKYIESKYFNDVYFSVYLTARNYRLISVTNNWLTKNGFIHNFSSLIVVFHPNFKMYFIKQALERNLDVTYIDDLSYNHENNHVKYYESIISEVKLLPIEYIDYNQILKINNDL